MASFLGAKQRDDVMFSSSWARKQNKTKLLCDNLTTNERTKKVLHDYLRQNDSIEVSPTFDHVASACNEMIHEFLYNMATDAASSHFQVPTPSLSLPLVIYVSKHSNNNKTSVSVVRPQHENITWSFFSVAKNAKEKREKRGLRGTWHCQWRRRGRIAKQGNRNERKTTRPG